MSGPEELRVLYVPYGRVHFLVNRGQCASSLYASEALALPSKHRYLGEVLRVEGNRLLFFDLDAFWRDSFRVSRDSGAELALVSDLSSFGARTRGIFAKVVFPRLQGFDLDMERIAFRIPSSTVMRNLDLGELAPHNGALRGRLEGKGIIALHPAPDSMGFLVDLDSLLGSRLLFAPKPEPKEGA